MKKRLEDFFWFINEDISKLNRNSLLILPVTSGLAGENFNLKNFLDLCESENDYELKKFFKMIQNDLIEMVDHIINEDGYSFCIQDLVVYLDEHKHFRFSWIRRKTISTWEGTAIFQTLIYWVEIEKIKVKFLELIFSLNLTPKRFKRCSKCLKYFYQPTARDTEYCSKECSGVVRQARYDKKKREERRINEKTT